MTRKTAYDCRSRMAPAARGATACDVRGQLAGGAADTHLAGNFECDLWPQCGCPDGTHKPDCPGLEQRPGSHRPVKSGADGFSVSIEEIDLEISRWYEIAGNPEATIEVVSRAHAAMQALRNVKMAIGARR